MWGIVKRLLYRIYKFLPVAFRWRISYALSRKFLVGMVFFIEREDGLLLVQHSYQKAWTLPGGWLEHGESIEEGTRREMREEFGAEATNIRIAAARAITVRPVIDISVICDLDGKPVADGSEVVNFSFFKHHELPAEIVASHRAYIDEFFPARL